MGAAARNEVIEPGHNVPVIAAATVVEIECDEVLAVSARSANIRIENGVATGRKELPPGFDGVLPSAGGSAMDEGDEQQLRFAVVCERFQKSRFDFQAVESFVFVELRSAERVLLPRIIQLRDLLRCALLVPNP